MTAADSLHVRIVAPVETEETCFSEKPTDRPLQRRIHPHHSQNRRRSVDNHSKISKDSYQKSNHMEKYRKKVVTLPGIHCHCCPLAVSQYS